MQGLQQCSRAWDRGPGLEAGFGAGVQGGRGVDLGTGIQGCRQGRQGLGRGAELGP